MPGFKEKGESEKSKIIDIAQLQRFARHPIRFFLQNELGIFFEPKREECFLSPYEKAILIRNALDSSPAEVIAQATDLLPTGLWGKVAEKEIEEGVLKYQSASRNLGLSLAERFSVHFTPAVSKPVYSEKEWQIPPFLIGNHLLVGKVEDLLPEGMVVYGSQSLANWIANWPRLFVFPYLQGILKNPQVYFLESCSKATLVDIDPISISEYLDLFPNLFPLPKWSALLIEQGEKALQKHLERGWHDPYASWALARGFPIPCSRDFVSSFYLPLR